MYKMLNLVPLLSPPEQPKDQRHPHKIQRTAEETFDARVRAVQRKKHLRRRRGDGQQIWNGTAGDRGGHQQGEGIWA